MTRKSENGLVAYVAQTLPIQWVEWWASLTDSTTKDLLASILFDDSGSLRDLTDANIRGQLVDVVLKQQPLQSLIQNELFSAIKAIDGDSGVVKFGPDPPSAAWNAIASDRMTLEKYPCGLRAGDIIRLRKDVYVRDYRGRKTGEFYPAGEENVVLMGNPQEPNIVWLQRPDREIHTWDNSVLQTFEPTDRRDPRFRS